MGWKPASDFQVRPEFPHLITFSCRNNLKKYESSQTHLNDKSAGWNYRIVNFWLKSKHTEHKFITNSHWSRHEDGNSDDYTLHPQEWPKLAYANSDLHPWPHPMLLSTWSITLSDKPWHIGRWWNELIQGWVGCHSTQARVNEIPLKIRWKQTNKQKNCVWEWKMWISQWFDYQFQIWFHIWDFWNGLQLWWNFKFYHIWQYPICNMIKLLI
jgi:hypothetical protein